MKSFLKTIYDHNLHGLILSYVYNPIILLLIDLELTSSIITTINYIHKLRSSPTVTIENIDNKDFKALEKLAN